MRKYIKFTYRGKVVYGEVLSNGKYYCRINAGEAFIKKEFPYYSERNPGKSHIDIVNSAIIGEVSEEEYLTAIVLES